MIKHNQLEDSSSQAGWMFADLFLALTVIFLATVSFIPTGFDNKSNSQYESKYSTQNGLEQQNRLTLISNGFIGEYSAENTKSFLVDLNNYMSTKGLPASTSALYLEVIGNTTDYGSPNDQGNLDALKFIIELRKTIPNVLSGTTTSINLSPDVKPNTIRIKLTFI